MGLPWNNSQLTPHHLHRLPQRPTWFLGGSWHWARLPRCQTSPEVNVHEGGGPVRDISGPSNSYDALVRGICLEILEVYEVGPRDYRILRHYWDIFTMVARTVRYYREAFSEFWGVTQGEPLFPTIFNVVVDAVVHNWVLLVVGGAGGLPYTLARLF